MFYYDEEGKAEFKFMRDWKVLSYEEKKKKKKKYLKGLTLVAVIHFAFIIGTQYGQNSSISEGYINFGIILVLLFGSLQLINSTSRV